MEIVLKQCATCKERKPLEAYTKSRGRLLGVYNYCKACVKAKYYAMPTAKLELVRGKARERVAAYVENNPNKKIESDRNSYQKNKPKRLESGKVYRIKNADKIKEQKKQSYHQDVEKSREQVRKRANVAVKELLPSYVTQVIRARTGIPTATIRQHPELIERTALVLQGQRIFKQLNQPTFNQQPNG